MSNLSPTPRPSALNKAKSSLRGSVGSNRSPKLDIAFSFDTTGSMYSYLEEVRRNLTSLSDEIKTRIPNARLGVIAFGDYCDAETQYVTQQLDLTSDDHRVRSFIHQVSATNGGDFPEAVEEALYQANQLSWRLGGKRAFVLVGDAPPHGVIDSFQKCLFGHNYLDEVQQLRAKGIKAYTVQCGLQKDTEKSFREMAKVTGGLYLNLDNMADLVDLLVGICMKEVGLLGEFESKLQSRRALTPSKRKLLKQLGAGTD